MMRFLAIYLLQGSVLLNTHLGASYKRAHYNKADRLAIASIVSEIHATLIDDSKLLAFVYRLEERPPESKRQLKKMIGSHQKELEEASFLVKFFFNLKLDLMDIDTNYASNYYDTLHVGYSISQLHTTLFLLLGLKYMASQEISALEQQLASKAPSADRDLLIEQKSNLDSFLATLEKMAHNLAVEYPLVRNSALFKYLTDQKRFDLESVRDFMIDAIYATKVDPFLLDG